MVTTIGAGVEYVGFPLTTAVAAPAVGQNIQLHRKGEWVWYTPKGTGVAELFCVMWCGADKEDPNLIKVGLKRNPKSRARLFYVDQNKCRPS